MIGSIRGTVTAGGNRGIILETQDGVGYEVQVTPAVASAATNGAALTLFTHHHIREDADELYGFPTREEVEFFRTLLSVSGVGPKLALAILASAPLAEVQRAIAERDAAVLQRVSGIGRKLAERIIVDLHERIGSAGFGGSGDAGALDALTALGYRADEARRALREVGTDADIGERVKAALKMLGRRGIRG
jgi:Holliday junction DNA helicase RuvA